MTMEYELIRSRSRRTVVLTLRPDGTLLVHAPVGTPRHFIDSFVHRKQDWITARQAELRRRNQAAADSGALTPEDISALTTRAKAEVPPMVARRAGQMGLFPGTVTIRHQKSRWGSCSSNGNLSFNCLLCCAPTEVLDYVIVHELCHLRHPNHSPAFWTEVAHWCPDYQQQEKWLKTEGRVLLTRMLLSESGPASHS